MSDIMVSIVCNTFNQEKYIRSAMNGFLMQQTRFPIEILVHDDASTDSTPEIVGEYAKKYPDIVKPILQTENQYSKQVAISEKFQFSRSRGKYIAFCEGDDYWTDPLKLQKQVDAMEQHPELDICSHQMSTERDGKKTGVVPLEKHDKIFSIDEVIAGGGGFVSTASLMFRRDLFLNPYNFQQMMSLDYIWQMAGALRGGMLYLSDCMGVYRQMSKGSWTATAEKYPHAQIEAWKKISIVLEVLNKETEYQYSKAINQQIAMMQLNPWIRLGDLKKVFSAEGYKLIHLQPVKQRMMIPLFTLRRWLMHKFV